MSLNVAHSLRRLDDWQQRTAALGIPVAVMKKFLDDGADELGVQIAYWGFFSVFALLLVFASVLGFVFQSNPELQHKLINSTLERMPVIGPQISGHIGSLTGSGVALAVGLVGALWTGLGVTLAIGRALDRTWAVPRVKRSGFLSSRLRGLLVLAAFGSINVLATVAVGLVTAGGVGTAAMQVLGLIASAVIDLVLFRRVLPPAHSGSGHDSPGPSRRPARGRLLARASGARRRVRDPSAGRNSQTYGGFAAVVGLLLWLLIAYELILIAAEVNVVLARSLGRGR
jgi:membrane protein